MENNRYRTGTEFNLWKTTGTGPEFPFFAKISTGIPFHRNSGRSLDRKHYLSDFIGGSKKKIQSRYPAEYPARHPAGYPDLIITSADELGEVLFSVAFVFLSVCPEDISRTVRVTVRISGLDIFVCMLVQENNSKTVIANNMRFLGFHITMPK